jgi:hypothetical protein
MTKKVHNEGLNNLYISTNTAKIIKLEDCDEQVCSTGSIKMRTRFVLKKYQGKGELGKCRRR